MGSVFDKIIQGDLPAKFVHKDEHCVAFEDANAQAPLHVLIVPKVCLERLSAAEEKDAATLGHLLLVAGKLGRKLSPEGFRVVINSGMHGGETVPHLHVHLLGQRKLGWPPG